MQVSSVRPSVGDWSFFKAPISTALLLFLRRRRRLPVWVGAFRGKLEGSCAVHCHLEARSRACHISRSSVSEAFAPAPASGCCERFRCLVLAVLRWWKSVTRISPDCTISYCGVSRSARSARSCRVQSPRGCEECPSLVGFQRKLLAMARFCRHLWRGASDSGMCDWVGESIRWGSWEEQSKVLGFFFLVFLGWLEKSCCWWNWVVWLKP